ncbi:hypothetical protein [Brucella pituitosa]|nr:hypothetical protein [Brucella pituitosa]
MNKHDFRTMALKADLKRIGLAALAPLITLAVYFAANAQWPYCRKPSR